MISKLIKPDFTQYFTSDKIAISFKKFFAQKANASAYLIVNKVVFIAAKNKNDYYEVMIHFLDLSAVNESLQAIKEELNQANFLMFLRNENAKEVHENIDVNLITQKILWQKLDSNTLLPKIELQKEFVLSESKVNSELESFFIDCFKDEWDENVSVWLNEFKDFNKQKGTLIIQDNSNNQIASSIMYWVFENYIYVFLIGTKTSYRRLKLGQFLMRIIQEKFPNKEIQLSSYKDADAYLFYQKLGFKDGSYSGLWF